MLFYFCSTYSLSFLVKSLSFLLQKWNPHLQIQLYSQCFSGIPRNKQILSLGTETGLLWKQRFGGCECMFSYLLLRREEGELLLTFADCSKISHSPYQAQTELSPASIKVPH